MLLPSVRSVLTMIRPLVDLLASALERVGNDGVITVEEGKTREMEVEYVDGMQFDKGYLSPYFINRPNDMDCEFENALVLIVEKKISNIRDIVPVLEKVGQTGQALLIIAGRCGRRSDDTFGCQSPAWHS